METENNDLSFTERTYGGFKIVNHSTAGVIQITKNDEEIASFYWAEFLEFRELIISTIVDRI